MALKKAKYGVFRKVSKYSKKYGTVTNVILISKHYYKRTADAMCKKAIGNCEVRRLK